MPRVISDNFLHAFIRNRELGIKKDLDYYEWSTDIWLSNSKRYVHLKPENEAQTDGAILNIKFSPDCKYLIAACENSSMLMVDPCTQKTIREISGAHEESVNCVQFLYENTFASGGDDDVIAIWDVRNLNSVVSRIEGHTQWVKDINYNNETKQLISSAVDGKVCLFELNKYDENGSVVAHELLELPNLHRVQLSRDFKRMVIATSNGLLLIIHDVNLDTLDKDVNRDLERHVYSDRGFSVEEKPYGTSNRIEKVKHFPDEAIPTRIDSLLMHPSGNYVLSRYISNVPYHPYSNYDSDNSLQEDFTPVDCFKEWLAVHDIQSYCDSDDRKSSRLFGHVETIYKAMDNIKQLSFNYDTRIFCSPFENWIRCYSFSDEFSDVEDVPRCRGKNQIVSKECIYVVDQGDILACQYSPCLPLLVSGDTDGNLSFYQPVF